MRTRTGPILVILGVLILAVIVVGPLSGGQSARSAGAPSAACTPGSWVFKAPYPLSVYGAAVATDGTFAYVTGGNTIGGAQHSETNRYDPVTDSWSPLAPEPFGADYLFHGEYGGNGKIYVMGGLTNGTLNRIYDIGTNSWTLGAPVPEAVYDYAHAFSGGKFYLMGGIVGGVASNAVFAYDVAANTWTPLAPLPQAEFDMAAGVIGGKIYVAGGSTGSDFITNLFIYDIAGNSWSAGPPMSVGANFPAGTVVGGTLWVIGGGNPFAPERAPSPDSFNNTQIFDPVANSWSGGPGLNQARSFADAVTLNVPGGEMALIVCGYNSTVGASLTSVEANTSSCATATPTPTPTDTPTNTPTNTPTPTPTPSGCVSPCVIPVPASPVVVTNCAAPPVTTSSSWTQINLPGSDVVLRCALNQLPGTTGVRILAHSILVDGPAGGSVNSSGTNGTQLIAGSGLGQCNAGATVDVESASVVASNPNGGLKITGCGDIVLNNSIINGTTSNVAVTSSGGRVCATGDSMTGSQMFVTAQGDLTMHGTTVTVATPSDNIKLISTAGSVLAGGGVCAPNRFTGGNSSNMTVTANGIIDLSSACVEIAQDITMTASGNGFVCATDAIINLGSAEIRNDFGQKGVITATACGGVGRIDIGNAILVDNGKSGGGNDPNKVSNLNGSLATQPVNCAASTVPTCTARPLDAANNPVSADPANRAAHNVTGVPRCDT